MADAVDGVHLPGGEAGPISVAGVAFGTYRAAAWNSSVCGLGGCGLAVLCFFQPPGVLHYSRPSRHCVVDWGMAGAGERLRAGQPGAPPRQALLGGAVGFWLDRVRRDREPGPGSAGASGKL